MKDGLQKQQDGVCILHKKKMENGWNLYIKIRMKSFKGQQGRAHFRGKKRKCPVKRPKLAKRTTVYGIGTVHGRPPAPYREVHRLLVIFF